MIRKRKNKSAGKSLESIIYTKSVDKFIPMAAAHADLVVSGINYDPSDKEYKRKRKRGEKLINLRKNETEDQRLARVNKWNKEYHTEMNRLCHEAGIRTMISTLIVLLFLTVSCYASGTIYQTQGITPIRDYDAPSYHYDDDGRVYQGQGMTDIEDYNEDAYVVEDDMAYKVQGQTNIRDYELEEE